MTKRQATILSALTITALVLAVLVSRRLWFRLDLTRNKTYTISSVSRNLHNEITDQVRITYYLSDRLKAIHPLPGEIEDLLREYVAFSQGKIRLTLRDPVKANLADQVERLGIAPQQIQTMEQDQASIMTVYTGLVIEYLDNIEVLPVVFSLETLEYDLTSRIRALIRERSRLLGVIVGDNPRRWNEQYRPLQSAYTQAGYQFQVINPGGEIPDTLPALLVLGGVETLDESTQYYIDRYIQTGGKVLFSVKSVHVETEETLEARLQYDGGLLAMLSSYGVSVLPEIAMDRSALTMQYQTRGPRGSIQFRITRNPQWIGVLGENGNPQHPASANFGGLDLYWANPLTLNAPEGVEADYLFTSTDEAWSMREPYSTNPENPRLMERDAPETRGRKILGASLAGTFPSWFAGRPKPQQPEGLELPDMPFEAKPSRIIVIGETEFATTFLNVTQGNRNLDFLVQAADWLCNDDDIIGIRNRETGSGRLDKITDNEKRAAAMKLAQIVNIFVVPLLVVVAGVLLALRRRAMAQPRGETAASKTGSEKEPQHGV